MRGRSAAAWLAILSSSTAGISQQPASPARCRIGTLEAEVRSGEAYVQPIGNGLEIMLEPLASGWIVRVLPAGRSRPAHDYAELATPPYHSVSPLLVSTDYSFRAQDAVGWNPRRFRFADSDAAFNRLLKAYDGYEGKGGPSPSAQQNLAALVSQAPEGTLTILDARLVPGTADQVQTASTVAAHFATTAHTIEKPADGKTSPLGKLTWLRFRIDIELRPGSSVDRRFKIRTAPCSHP